MLSHGPLLTENLCSLSRWKLQLEPAHLPKTLSFYSLRNSVHQGPGGPCSGGAGWEEEDGDHSQWSALAVLSHPGLPIPALQDPPCKLLSRGPGLHLCRVAFLCRGLMGR